jgi:hypothetical protein
MQIALPILVLSWIALPIVAQAQIATGQVSTPDGPSVHAAIKSKLHDPNDVDPPGMSKPEYVGIERGMRKFLVTYRWGGGKNGHAYVLVKSNDGIECIKFGVSDYCSKYYTPAERVVLRKRDAEMNARSAKEAAERYKFGDPYPDRSGATDCVRRTGSNTLDRGSHTKTVDGYGNQRTDSFVTRSQHTFRNICSISATYKFHSDYVSIGAGVIDTWSCNYYSGENAFGTTISKIDSCSRVKSLPLTRSKQ